jgi:hypothetical protein
MERQAMLTIPGLMIAFLIPVTIGCDKTESAAQRFVKEGRWTITSITVYTTVIDKLPKWDIPFCTDFSSYNSGTWEHPLGTSAGFLWKFSNIGGTFTFEPDSILDTGSMAYAQCSNFSGEYKVIKSKRHTFHFESTATLGYPGKVVTILLEHQ